MNLGLHVNDEPTSVLKNREKIRRVLDMPSAPIYLSQVHGTELAEVDRLNLHHPITADAATTSTPGRVLAIMTADCLPVAITNAEGSRLTLVHAGWRGLAAGVLDRSLCAFSSTDELHAWLGPAIGPTSFEVGQDVYDAFVKVDSNQAAAFRPMDNDPQGQPKYLADIYALATRVLTRERSVHLSGGNHCTFNESARFYSHRRDNLRSGRMAMFGWIDAGVASE